MRFRRLAGTSARLAVLLVFPASAGAQAVLIGRTIGDSSRAPISGAEAVIEKLGLRAQSDSDGRFTLADIKWGVHIALVRKVGYRPVRLQLMVASDDTMRVDIRLRTATVELPPLEVTASSVPAGMEDYARRRLAGWGHYFAAKELRQSEHRRLSDLMSMVPGVRTVTNGFRAVLVSRRGNCPMAVWLDGVQIFAPGMRRAPPDIDAFPVSQLEAVEVYSGPAETPMELSARGTCGAVALWTRRG